MDIIATKFVGSSTVKVASIFVPGFDPIRLRPLMPKFFLCHQQAIYVMFQLLYLVKIVCLSCHSLCLLQLFFLLHQLSCNITKVLFTPPFQTWLAIVDFSCNICHRKGPKILIPCRVDCFMAAPIIKPYLFESPRVLLLSWDAHRMDYDGFMVWGTALKSEHLCWQK